MQIATVVPMPRRDWHVVFERSSMLWAVRRENNPDVWQYTITKLEAVGLGMTQAREGYASLIIHGMDGRIQSVKSYANWSGPRD
jgi:hypothetical protein